MKHRQSLIVYSLILIQLVLYSCNSSKKRTEVIDEGYIEYKMEYKGDSMETFVQQFLPKKMRIVFKDNNTKNRISDPTGIISFTHIRNYDQKLYTTLVSVLTHKYKYIEETETESIFYQNHSNFQIKPTDDSKIIAGFHCRKAEVTYKKDQNTEKKFNIYYTDQIEIKGFTSNTPFKEIEGVLMEFQLKIYQIPMMLTAIKVQEKNISPGTFEIPPGHKRVNKKSMNEIIELLKER